MVFLTPFLGIPNDWKEYVVIGSGVLLMFIGYSLRRSAYFRRTDAGNGERQADSFMESRAQPTNPVTAGETSATNHINESHV